TTVCLRTGVSAVPDAGSLCNFSLSSLCIGFYSLRFCPRLSPRTWLSPAGAENSLRIARIIWNAFGGAPGMGSSRGARFWLSRSLVIAVLVSCSTPGLSVMGSVLHVGDDVERGGQRAGSATVALATERTANSFGISAVLNRDREC